MFGYITVNKPELKIKEFDEYRAYYCGLCGALRKRCGLKGQLSLSYDLTFLAMLLTGLYDGRTEDVPCKCIFHPLDKMRRKENQFLSYAADMNLLLTYYKCRDDWADEKKAAEAVYGKILHRHYQSIKKRYAGKIQAVEENFNTLARAEKAGIDDIDFLSGCFGKILSEIFAYRKDEWEEPIRRMGFMLGRFIYIMDAYEDLEKDRKKGNFNPFKKKADNPGFDEWIKDILTVAASSCAEEFEKLPVIENVEILRNILYSGIWTRYERVLSSKNGKR